MKNVENALKNTQHFGNCMLGVQNPTILCVKSPQLCVQDMIESPPCLGEYGTDECCYNLFTERKHRSPL